MGLSLCVRGGEGLLQVAEIVVDGLHQPAVDVSHRGIRDLGSGGGAVSAAPQHLQDGLDVDVADAALGENHAALFREEDKGGANTLHVEQVVGGLGGDDPGDGPVDGGHGHVFVAQLGVFDDLELGDGVGQVVLEQLFSPRWCRRRSGRKAAASKVRPPVRRVKFLVSGRCRPAGPPPRPGAGLRAR